MPTRSGPLTRWVLRRRDNGEFATDERCGYSSPDLADAHVFAGRPAPDGAYYAVTVRLEVKSDDGGDRSL